MSVSQRAIALSCTLLCIPIPTGRQPRCRSILLLDVPGPYMALRSGLRNTPPQVDPSVFAVNYQDGTLETQVNCRFVAMTGQHRRLAPRQLLPIMGMNGTDQFGFRYQRRREQQSASR